MNSNPMSVGRICLAKSLGQLLVVLLLASCSSIQTKDRMTPSELEESKKPANAESEVSLAKDRSELETLRKDIPPDTQKKNDELALIFELMQEGKTQPSDLQSRFDRLARRKRDQFRDEGKKHRDTYTREERTKREKFLKDIKFERDSFTSHKHEPEETRNFYQEMETKRRDFFADEQEKRRNFESDMRAKSSDFEQNLRDVQQRFNETYRAYSRDYNERKRIEDKQKSMKHPNGAENAMPAGSTEDSEYQEMQNQRGTKLGP